MKIDGDPSSFLLLGRQEPRRQETNFRCPLLDPSLQFIISPLQGLRRSGALAVKAEALLPPDQPTPVPAPTSRAPTSRSISHIVSRMGRYTSAASIRATRNQGESGMARTAANTGTPR